MKRLRVVKGQERFPGMERDYRAEAANAASMRALQVGELAVLRNDGTLGDEPMKIPQFSVLCSLPYSRTAERQLTRRSRLSDGSTLLVTFTAAYGGKAMPFGGDRRLLFWMFDKALRLNSPIVPWDKGSEYLKAMGMRDCGKNRNDLRERFGRISGLAIGIERQGVVNVGALITVLAGFQLPSHLAPEGESNVTCISDEDGFCFVLSPGLWSEIKKHHAVLPKKFWMHLKGSWRVQDAMMWLAYRVFSAQSPSVVPWAGLREQFPQDDSNPQRMKSIFRLAAKQLVSVWPDAQVEVVREGIRVAPSRAMLPDDPVRKRIRQGGLDEAGVVEVISPRRNVLPGTKVG